MKNQDKKPLIFGHRGAAGYCPENTRSSFQKAIELGADFIEIDVHMTKDGQLIVHHDPDTKRTSGQAGVIRELTLEQLQKLDIGSWYHASFADERIMLLEDVLNEFLPKAGILIELKHPEFNPGLPEALTRLLSRYSQQSSQLFIQSFHADVIKRMHRLLPAVRGGLLLRKKPFGISRRLLKETAQYASFINVKHTIVSPRLVKKAHKQRLLVFTWTINSPAKLKKALKSKADGILTDYPDLVRSVK